MQRFVKAPLVFLLIGTVLGLVLRWQFVVPTRGLTYTFVLHGHSHGMFLGWIFNALYIGFTLNHIPASKQHLYRRLFIVLQVLVVGMLVSFPLQGYGVYSIVLSTLHTVLAVVYAVLFYRHTRGASALSVWHARTALLFFVVSAIGPFALGYLMATGLAHSQWYYFAIYFYLHFQYNGFFFFGVLSLLYAWLEQRHVVFNTSRAKRSGLLFAIACVPAYILSTLWAKPGLAYNILGGVAALVQLLALQQLWRTIHDIASRNTIKHKVRAVYFHIILIVLVVKLVLQFASAFPYIAHMAYSLRPVVIAYLHLVLVGAVSLSLLLWYVESGYLGGRRVNVALVIFVVAFVGMELCLVLYPWWTAVFGAMFPPAAVCTFVFSAGLGVAALLFVASKPSYPDKGQPTA